MIQILLATYNGEKYIRTQLESIFAQSYTEFEILVSDDGSTDRTIEIIEDFREKYPGKIRFIPDKTPSGGAKNNFFKLMGYADSDYIMFCDQDDYWLCDKIELTVNKMRETEENGLPVLVHTDLSVADENLNITHNSYFKMHHLNYTDKLNCALVQNCVTGCTVMINKPLLELVKNRNGEGVIMHDWWLYITACAFGKVAFIDTQTILYRQHSCNAVGANNRIKSTSEMVNSVNKTILNASHFLKSYKNILSENHKALVSDYANIKNINPLKRFSILRKYKLYKYPLAKKILQVIITLFII